MNFVEVLRHIAMFLFGGMALVSVAGLFLAFFEDWYPNRFFLCILSGFELTISLYLFYLAFNNI